ncbi:hypothetical protein AKJ16_DCAP24788, partial [Drosera capensis]
LSKSAKLPSFLNTENFMLEDYQQCGLHHATQTMIAKQRTLHVAEG